MSGALPREFEVIARHFRPLAGAGALNLADDAAVVLPPSGRALVVAADAMVQGVHFLPDDPPDLVARKLLRVNLSDLAAMGAAPLGYLLTVSVPRGTPDAWFAAFAAGLAYDQAAFGLTLLGGDTTSTPGPVGLSLTVLGSVAPGQVLMRAGAQPGDGIWVSGTIGDGALGLLAAQGAIADPDGFLADRYRLPQPRLALGAGLAGIAHACMDVSDGLIQDLGHLCRASSLAAVLLVDSVPLSVAALPHMPGARETVLTGGDDYELLCAVPPEREMALGALARACGVALTRIGAFAAPSPSGEHAVGVRLADASGAVALPRASGWSHLG